MKFCKSYAYNLICPNTECNYEHHDLKFAITSEMDFAINGRQWPLSCFGPIPEERSIPCFIEDQSFEEVRMQFYGPNNDFIKNCKQFSSDVTFAKHQMDLLCNMNELIFEELVEYFCRPTPKPRHIEENNYSANLSLQSFFNSGSPYNIMGLMYADTKENATDKELSKSVPGQSSGSRKSQQEVKAAAAYSNLLNKKRFSFDLEEPGTPVGCCEECRRQLEKMSAKVNTVISATNKINATLHQLEKGIKSLVENLKQINFNEKLEITKNTEKANKSIPLVRIKAKRSQNSAATKSEIEKKLKTFGLQIESISISIDGGSIDIKCKDQGSVVFLKYEFGDKCGRDYEVEIVKLANPQIMIKGIDTEIDGKNLIKHIRMQYILFGDVNLIRSFENNKSEYYDAIIEVEKNLYKVLMKGPCPYITIGRSKYYLYENLNVGRCCNCWGFDHQTTICWRKVRCPKCCGTHSVKNCRSAKLRCSNCVMENSQRAVKLDSKHDARDQNCPVYINQLQRLRYVIDY